MAELPYLTTTVTDHLAATAHLSAEAMGAYEVLRCHYWLRQGALPVDDDKLARLARMPLAAWRKVAGDVLGLFYKSEDGYKHVGLEAELERARKRSRMAQTKARLRWGSADAPATALPGDTP